MGRTRKKPKRATCKICKKSIATKHSLIYHIRSFHTGIKPHKCSHCGKAFVTPTQLRRHKLLIHSKTPPSFVCKECGKSCKLEFNLKRHIKKIHLLIKNPIVPCYFCKTGFRSSNSFNYHLLKHTRELPYSCPICREGFRAEQYYKLHLKDVDGKEYVCPKCPPNEEKFCGMRRLQSHLRLKAIHEPPKPPRKPKVPGWQQIKFPLCQKPKMQKTKAPPKIKAKPFNYQTAKTVPCYFCHEKHSKSKITSHMRTHTLEKLYYCKICLNKSPKSKYASQYYLRKYKLYQHIRRHLNERPCKCNVCPKWFITISNLKTHERCRHQMHKRSGTVCERCDVLILNKHFPAHFAMHKMEEPYSCACCYKTFKTKNDMKIHRVEDHENQEGIICPVQCREFIKPSEFEAHLASHDPKPFTCYFCAATFITSGNLRNHIHLHFLERPLPCSTCSAEFVTKRSLEKHYKVVIHPSQEMGRKWKKPKRATCKICKKSIARKHDLIYHIRSFHTGIRPHKCSHCEKAFVTPTQMRRHTFLLHSNTPPSFVCKECGKSCKLEQNLKRHIEK
ncbi:Zinc finger protein 26 [Folsomia candida]|uniref:Zinc finger protein 26 n=1 Tax=Folsomia candida TaxID=158441 RepID=A0A226D8G4_FOLCA|nr:Zinc finger protein 26 [Folsomia candida]